MRRMFDGQAHTRRETFTLRHLLGVFMWMLLVFAGFFYVLAALVLGDPFWFRPAPPFTASPNQFTVVKQGQARVIRTDDPQFAAIRDALNATINHGYNRGTGGFSDTTWDEMQRMSFYIDARYAEPVQLDRRGDSVLGQPHFAPASQLRILLEGSRDEHAGLLFQHGDRQWNRIPLRLNTIEPLVQALE